VGLYKRGQVWWMRFGHRGEKRKSTRTTNPKLAQRIYDKVKGKIAEGQWFERLPGEDITFKGLMEKYMSEHSAPNKAPKTHLRDKSLNGHLVDYFGKMALTQITARDIADYKVKRRDEGAAPETINNELILMGHAFSLAVKEWEWVRENPVRKVSKERADNPIERWLTVEEEKNLLAEAPIWLQDIIRFAINTGLRQGEILDLQWPQVDLDRKILLISKQKNRSRDTLPLNETAWGILKDKERVRRKNTVHVFYNENGKPIDARNLLRAFYSATKKANIAKLRFHDLRHTFATRLVQAGVDIYTVQKLGRWKTISMIMRYAHHHSESLRAGVEVLDRVNGRVVQKVVQPIEKGVAENCATP